MKDASALVKLLEIFAMLIFFGYTHISKAAAAECPPKSSDLKQEVCYCLVSKASVSAVMVN